MAKKIGFWAVFSLVTGSQIGSGVFMLPASLAPYGVLSIAGWVCSAIGAIALSLVFAALCGRFPRTGGPHVYTGEAFGPKIAFFTGWTYWIISWVSTTAVVVACVGYLSPLFGFFGSTTAVFLELAIVFAIALLNLRGIHAAGQAEFFLTLLKFVPLILLPIIGLFSFDAANFVTHESTLALSTPEKLAQISLLTLWGFIGLESGTTPAGSVENPEKTIPRAVVFGTIAVAILYILNSVGVMGVVPGDVLAQSRAPYVEATQRILGGQWHLVISAIAAIVCLGTLNAWVLASSQIALGLAEDGLFPQFFAKKNRHGAPIGSILISTTGLVPLIVLTANESLVKQLTEIIDFSVTAFLFVYLAASFALVRILLRERSQKQFLIWCASIVAIIFSVWVICQTPLKVLGIASLFTISGLPVFIFMRKKILAQQVKKTTPNF